MKTVAQILEEHRGGQASPETTIRNCYVRIREQGDPAIFITLRDEADAVAEAKTLGKRDPSLPLYGIPVAVKDNIDVAGLPTTAACPAFAYTPEEDATAVKRLREAGAIVIGKTNLDQFATGLVGVRSPYGVPRNALDPKLIPGGSSSGSAVAVASGIVPLALGTDTAGSGRVPAMLNNLVGLKPSLGLISTFGVVPACRTLDCVSVFALTVDDAWAALSVMAGFDARDPYSQHREAGRIGAMPPHLRVGILRGGEREFFGDKRAGQQYEAALKRLSSMGASLVEIDFAPFAETARLLYEGPWVAERCVAARELLLSNPDAIHPVTREIIAKGIVVTALDAFEAFYRLRELQRKAAGILADVDILAVPTAPTSYTLQEILDDPVRLNSRLGTYTNFVNLLDMCGLAIPSAFRDDRRGFGITLLAPGGNDGLLASVGRRFCADGKLPLGANKTAQPAVARIDDPVTKDEIAVAVLGAHMSGMPLNKELAALGGRFIREAKTAPDYRLFALPTSPAKPGLLRVAKGKGHGIAMEIWALPAESFGRFVAAVPPPLSIGTIETDGTPTQGFLVEAEAAAGARDISKFGGWRQYLSEG